MIEFHKLDFAGWVGVISGVLGILSFFGYFVFKNQIKNILRRVSIGGDYIGSKGKSSKDKKVVNDLKDVKIKGDYTGSEDS